MLNNTPEIHTQEDIDEASSNIILLPSKIIVNNKYL